MRGEEPGHLFERLAEPQPPFDVGRQEMEADAQRAVAAGGGLGDGGFRRAAFLQAEFEQVQEQPGALVAAQGQGEQEVDDVNDAADGQQAQEQIDHEGQGQHRDGLERVGMKELWEAIVHSRSIHSRRRQTRCIFIIQVIERTRGMACHRTI